MARIAVLPDAIASRIAAGEVVERPASAVKELVENAIDARCRTVEVVLEAGGRDTIIVTDDGEGMGQDDTLLCLERHATSKITTDAQIERVSTLGFRGEALPAIASVSRFRLASRDAASETATVVEVNGGRLVSVTRQAAPQGTRVEARALFYNVPARRKFLRSAETERQKAVEMVSRFAIGYPEIRFQLIAEGKPVFDHAPVPDPLERCAQVFGRQLTSRLHPIEAAAGSLRLVGLCSGIDETRSHSRDQHLYVNRRPVRDRLLAHAIGSSYYEALPRGRHPVLILLLSLPHEAVDVNVHPAKSEVRFRRPGEVHDFLASALKEALRGAGVVPTLRAVVAPSADGCAPSGLGGAGPQGGGRASGSSGLQPLGRADREAMRPGPPPARDEATGPVPGRQGSHSEPGAGASGSYASESWRFQAAEPEPKLRPALPPLPLGQYLDSYILAADGADLLIIDQHAAHERVLFERILEHGEGGAIPVQRLLIPVPIELGPADRKRADQYLAALNAAGFEAEGFGEGAILLRGLPAAIESAEPEALVREILSDLRAGESPAAPAEISRRIAATTACHGAIKVRFPLSREKMGWVVNELFSCSTPTTCPHGRPTVLRVGLREIEKGFHRI